MKKMIILMSLAASTLGCAYGINHNIATINGEQYLVESKNRMFLYIAEWSSKPTFYKLDQEALNKDARRAHIEELREECAEINAYRPAVAECLKEKLKEERENKK